MSPPVWAVIHEKELLWTYKEYVRDLLGAYGREMNQKWAVTCKVTGKVALKMTLKNPLRHF